MGILSGDVEKNPSDIQRPHDILLFKPHEIIFQF